VTVLSLAYDMRAPEWGAPAEELYRAALEQSAWADRNGFSNVVLMEHHATTDGYLPSPIVMGAAVAGLTATVVLRLSLVLLPLYQPLRVAEDLAVLDLISAGRLRVTVGLGYRQEEYDQFGVNIKRRPSLMEEAVETLKRAWSGESFQYQGRTVRILPRPAQRPRPAIYMGGASPASARRAARLADGYQPLSPRLYEIYLEELARLGKPEPPVDPGAVGGRGYIFVAEDPDQEWHRIAPHALHDANAYASWIGDRPGTFKAVADADELRRSGTYRVVTPEECLEIARDEGAVTFKPLVGGLAPAVGWASLELFATTVLPKLMGFAKPAATRDAERSSDHSSHR
jgi:alkanesulfonate monooxygenase SsuD/methylene tetrahydromethanopterin reductase-like flavin-dependent oxidoreductase (luciferase family)